MAVVSNVEIRVNAKNAIQQFDLLQRKAKELNGTLDRTETESQQAGVSFGGLAAKVTALIGGIATLKKGLDAAFARGAAEQRLRNLTSSTAEYELSLKMAAVAAADFGLTQTQATEALGDTYSRLRGVGFGLQEVNEIYRGFNTVAKQSGVTAEAASGAFLQLGQALGSGTLQGDELRSILEQMPQLTQIIAAEMGVAAGSIRKLGSEGKITSDVIYKALARAAESSGDLSGKLTQQQATMAQVAQRADEMFVQLGKALAPAFLTAMDQLSKGALILSGAFRKVNEFVSANEEKIKGLLKVGLEIGKMAAAVFIVVKAYQAYQKAVAAVATAKAFLVGLTGKGLALVATGAAAAAVAYGALNVGIGAAGDEVKKLQAESEQQLKQMKSDINNAKGAYSSIPPVVDDIKKKQEQVNATLKQQTALAEQAARSQVKTLTDNLSLAEARYGTEKQLLSNQIQQAQAAGNSNKVYQLKVKLAELDYDIAVQRIKAEVRKLEIAKQLAKAKVKELEVAVLQTAEGSKEEARLKRAVALQIEAVKQATENLSRGKELAKEQIKGAAAVKAGAIAAAKAERSAAANAKATQAAAQASGQYANNMERGANAAGRAASSLSKLTGGLGQKSKAYTTTGTISIKGASQEAIARAGGLEQFNQASYLRSGFRSALSQWNQFADKVLTIDRQLSASGATRTPAYASGGYVSSPTNAMIGEGGSEYVIPASKMSAAMERYAAGKRGDAVVPNGNDTQVNVSTGPVMQMNGQNYVTQSDFEKGLRSTVNQVMTTLRRSPNTRAAVGI